MSRALDLFRDLHAIPELSGEERVTADRVAGFFDPLAPDRLLTDLGGHGLAAVFDGPRSGPTVLLRADLDAIPADTPRGAAHRCGHDGHAAILSAVGEDLAARRPPRGRVVLLFQPAEETGRGAAAVRDDPRYEALVPDWAFALHNLPGYPLGRAVVREGAFNRASRGLTLTLTGAPAHAAQPGDGRSPARALGRILADLDATPAAIAGSDGATFATAVGARLGAKAFGTAPGRGEIWVTLRSDSDAGLARLADRVDRLARTAASADGLAFAAITEDDFTAVINTARGTDVVRRAAPDAIELAAPLPWSEDFGVLLRGREGAMFGLGAGVDCGALHAEDYAFDPALIDAGRVTFGRIVARCLARDERRP